MRCSPTMATLRDTRFVECRWWNEGWMDCEHCRHSSASMTPAPVLQWSAGSMEIVPSEGSTADCLLVAERPSNRLVYFRDGSPQTILRAAHTETELADQIIYLAQSSYTDTGPTSPSADPIMPGALQGSPLECQFLSH